MTTQDMLTKVKLLAGITDVESDQLLSYLIETVRDKVLADTRQTNLPSLADNLIVEMSFDAWSLRQEAVKADAGEVSGSVSSVSDNGQSVSYRESAYATVLKTVSDGFLKNYEDRLAPFRKPGW